MDKCFIQLKSINVEICIGPFIYLCAGISHVCTFFSKYYLICCSVLHKLSEFSCRCCICDIAQRV